MKKYTGYRKFINRKETVRLNQFRMKNVSVEMSISPIAYIFQRPINNAVKNSKYTHSRNNPRPLDTSKF